MPSRPLQHLCLGCLIAVPASGMLTGAELVVADLRLGLDLRPTDFDYTVSNSLGSITGSDSFETGLGFSLRGLHAFDSPGASGGFVLGGEGTFAYHEYGSEESAYTTYGLRVMGGYRYAITENWAIGALAFAGLGLASFEIADSTSFDDITADGTVLEFGALLGTTYSLGQHWITELEFGWLESEADMEGSGLDVTVEESGFTVFFGLNYRFGGGRPPVLE